MTKNLHRPNLIMGGATETTPFTKIIEYNRNKKDYLIICVIFRTDALKQHEMVSLGN